MPSRRRALGLIAAAPFIMGADAAPPLSRARYRLMTVIDAKCWLERYGLDSPPDRFAPLLLDAAKASGATIISQTQGGSGTLDNLKTATALMDKRIKGSADRVMKVLTAADLKTAKTSGKLGIAYDVQGTSELEGDAANVAVLKDLGIRTVQLTYNLKAAAGDGCMVPNDGGITPFGRAVVGEVNRLKMLIDFSHVGHRTAADGIKESTRPPAITHSGCHALNPHPRNMPDAQMKALADKGGVFGIYFMSYLIANGQEHGEDVIRHIEHAIKVCGEDHVGIGTDGRLPPLVFDQAYKDYWRKDVYEARVKNGTVAPNEGADIFNYAPEYNPADRYALVGDDLIRRGHSVDRVEKILGGNFARLYSEVWS